MVAPKIIKADPEFARFLRSVQDDIEPIIKRRPTQQEVTRGIAEELDAAKFRNILAQRTKNRRRKGWYF